MVDVRNRLYRFQPKLGPEWGSGGIFGLKYHRDVLYFTLAFEAQAHFYYSEYNFEYEMKKLKIFPEHIHKIYNFDLIGKAPRSGGDTYNAVTAVDEKIYFGGWIHAPAIYENKTLKFTQKFSHLHCYDIADEKVKLLWKDGPGEEDGWAGEVSEVLYDELNNKLYIARGDGHFNLGLFVFDLDKNEMKMISDEPALKGTQFFDKFVFNTGALMFEGLQYVDIDTQEHNIIEVERDNKMAKDGEEVYEATLVDRIGCMGTTANQLFVFLRGGFFKGNPFTEAENSEPPMSFIRLFDFPRSSTSPFRANVLPIRGGLLTAYNALPDTFGMEKLKVFMPSVLVFISPPMVKIVGVFGARITSIEKMGSSILVAGNTMPNTIQPIPMDSGHREISVLSDDIIDRHPPAFEISVHGSIIEDKVWGGIPLTGYTQRRMIIHASKPNKIAIFEYTTEFPNYGEQLVTYENIMQGKNVIDLDGYAGITSFKFENTDKRAKVSISLR